MLWEWARSRCDNPNPLGDKFAQNLSKSSEWSQGRFNHRTNAKRGWRSWSKTEACPRSWQNFCNHPKMSELRELGSRIWLMVLNNFLRPQVESRKLFTKVRSELAVWRGFPRAEIESHLPKTARLWILDQKVVGNGTKVKSLAKDDRV